MRRENKTLESFDNGRRLRFIRKHRREEPTISAEIGGSRKVNSRYDYLVFAKILIDGNLFHSISCGCEKESHSMKKTFQRIAKEMAYRLCDNGHEKVSHITNKFNYIYPDIELNEISKSFKRSSSFYHWFASFTKLFRLAHKNHEQAKAAERIKNISSQENRIKLEMELLS